MQMISEAIVNGSLQAVKEAMAERDTKLRERAERGSPNRAARRRQKAIDKQRAKRVTP